MLLTEEFCVRRVPAPQSENTLSLLVHFIQIEEEDPSSKRCHKNNSLFLRSREVLGGDDSSRQRASAEEFSHSRPTPPVWARGKSRAQCVLLRHPEHGRPTVLLQKVPLQIPGCQGISGGRADRTRPAACRRRHLLQERVRDGVSSTKATSSDQHS